MAFNKSSNVIPAQAGIQTPFLRKQRSITLGYWIPASAGMTIWEKVFSYKSQLFYGGV
jgi:hypothetical protein